VLALAVGLMVPGRGAAQELPAGPDLVPVAQAYVAAWNAHDLPAVLALFAPDAVVRERRGAVPAAVWDTRDPQVVRDYLDGARDGDHYDTGGLVWALGHRQIAAWAAGRFALHHRFALGRYRAAGDTVGWPYRAFAGPSLLAQGVGPVEGDAEAVVRGGRIAVLSLVHAPASVRRQRDELAAAAAAAHHASLRGDGPRRRPSRSRESPGAADPPGAAWPLALGGLALLGVVTRALRRRRPPLP
jgi:hypothetical protein